MSAKDLVLTDSLVQDLKTKALRAQHALPEHPGRWELQTGCSFRRIGTSFGDGVVLRGTVHPRDRWPDIQAKQEVFEHIVAADPAMILALLKEREELLAQVKALQDAAASQEMVS